MVSVSSSEQSKKTLPTDGVLCVGLFCLIGLACRRLLRPTRVPYTVALLIIGIALGYLEFGSGLHLGKFGDGIRLWAKIDPDLLLAVFLPPLLFEGSFSMEVHQIKKCMAQMVLLAGPGVIISTFCIGSALKLTLPYEWSWQTSLLLGAVLSATDPVAVVALLKEIGTSKKMSTIIEGESMMNDGASIVVYHLFYNMVLGRHFNWGSIVKYLTLATVGALGIGIAFAVVSALWLALVSNDPVTNLSLTLAVSYTAYFTAQQGFDVSGILAVVHFGNVRTVANVLMLVYILLVEEDALLIFRIINRSLAAFARTTFSSDARLNLHHVWELIAYIANTVIFILRAVWDGLMRHILLSGIIMAEGIINSDNLYSNGSSWGYLVLVYIIVQFSRVIIVVLLYPALQYFGYGFNWKEAALLTWSGLRGAVGLAMALSVKRASNDSLVITSETGSLFLFLTAGTVFFTLVVNGSTAQFLLSLLGMDKLSHIEQLMMDNAKYNMMNKYLEAQETLCDGGLEPINWPSIDNYVYPTFSSSSVRFDQLNLLATRVQLLNAVQASYWRLLDDGRITHLTANFLMSSVDEATDAVSQEPLCDWRSLKAFINFQTYNKVLNTGILPQRLVTYITTKRLQFACYICVAFLDAHRAARRKVRDFVGETENVSAVLNESEAEEKEAAKFLEEVLLAFPQVVCSVRTTQVTCSMLHLLKDYIQNLEMEGLLDEKLGVLLHDLLMGSVKKSFDKPLQAAIPCTKDVIRAHPLLQGLPNEVRRALEGSMKQLVKPRDMILCNKGSMPRCFLLIQNGLLKWETKSSNGSDSTTRALAEYCVLGLYETLARKPFICDISTDCMVLCYVIEAKTLLPLVASNPFVQNLFWQESVLVLAKLLLPEVLEMPMQGVRALIAERLSMATCVALESIVVAENSIVFLLDGVLRNQDHPGIVVEPPALLLPSHGSLVSSTSEMSATPRSQFCHYGHRYQVETAARLAYVDISGWSSGSSASPLKYEERHMALANVSIV